MLNLPAKKVLFLILLLITIIILFLFIPIEFSYSVTTPGKIMPAKSWIVVKGSNGQLISLLHNRKKGIIDNYSVKEFERGDNVSLALGDDFRIGKSIIKNDTIGYLYSSEIERQLAELSGEIEITKSLLEFNRSGEKESVIKEAEENLKFQIKNAEDQKRILERQRSLFDKNLISKEEYELTLSQAELNEISIAIARARLESVSTGAKEEQIELINNQLRSLQNQTQILKKRLSSYNLISPINGVVNSITSGDTLFTISDNSEFILLIPVKFNDLEFIEANSNVNIHLQTSSESINAAIEFIDNTTYEFGGNQVVLAVASIKKSKAPLANGLMVECEIDGGYASAFEHLKRFMNKSIF